MPGQERALLIYDGACAFCRIWIDHWRGLTGERVQYASSQEIAAMFPDVPREKYARAVHLIDEDGSRHEGAAAVFRLMAKRPGYGWVEKLYDAPAVAPVSEWCYRLVARHRPFFLRVTRLLWGKKIEASRYGLTARLFLQALAIVYFIAFISLLPQLPGLVGERGLLPAETYLEGMRAQHGAMAVWIAPTLAWFGAHAGALQFMALMGAFASLLAFGGILIAPCFLLMWVLYLSLTVVGQEFTAFQWDALLLEAGFLAIFLTPFRRTIGYRARLEGSAIVIWLYRFLLFRLVFMSGALKLLSGDRAWRNMTALSFHFQTQPLPTALAWFAHQLPLIILKMGTLLTLGMELIVPFLFFLPRRARRLGALLTAGFQVAMILTGNFAFFNWLILTLCLLLLDDDSIESVLPRLKAKQQQDVMPPEGAWRRRTIASVAVLLLTLGVTRLVVPFMRVPTPLLLLAAATAPFHISNDYGLFAVMTTVRPEIILEGSTDGVSWKEYAFKAKPGEVKHMPGFVAPFQPRLDWQMWFAALGEPDAQSWVANLMIRLLQGSKPVLALFAENPFPDAPPRFVRATLYVYRFSTPEERNRDGAWWRRELKAAYLPMLSLTGSAL